MVLLQGRHPFQGVLRPRFLAAILNLGRAYQASGALEHAIEEFQKALVIRPDSGEAHSLLGLALKQKGIEDLAQAHLEQATKCGKKLSLDDPMFLLN